MHGVNLCPNSKFIVADMAILDNLMLEQDHTWGARGLGGRLDLVEDDYVVMPSPPTWTLQSKLEVTWKR